MACIQVSIGNESATRHGTRAKKSLSTGESTDIVWVSRANRLAGMWMDRSISRTILKKAWAPHRNACSSICYLLVQTETSPSKRSGPADGFHQHQTLSHPEDDQRRSAISTHHHRQPKIHHHYYSSTTQDTRHSTLLCGTQVCGATQPHNHFPYTPQHTNQHNISTRISHSSPLFLTKHNHSSAQTTTTNGLRKKAGMRHNIETLLNIGFVERNPGLPPSTKLRICHVNINNITAEERLDELDHFAEDNGIDILTVFVTKLDDNVHPGLYPLNNFHTPSTRHRTRHGGGVTTYNTRSSLPTCRLTALETEGVEWMDMGKNENEARHYYHMQRIHSTELNS